jgi:hypothetical protein
MRLLRVDIDAEGRRYCGDDPDPVGNLQGEALIRFSRSTPTRVVKCWSPADKVLR